MNVAWYNGIVLIAIVGLGLIGGSIGLALKKAEASEWEIAGWSRRRETTARALDLGAIDRPAASGRGSQRGFVGFRQRSNC